MILDFGIEQTQYPQYQGPGKLDSNNHNSHGDSLVGMGTLKNSIENYRDFRIQLQKYILPSSQLTSVRMQSLIHDVSEPHSVIHSSESSTHISIHFCSSSISLNYKFSQFDLVLLTKNQYLRTTFKVKSKTAWHWIRYFSHDWTDLHHLMVD